MAEENKMIYTVDVNVSNALQNARMLQQEMARVKTLVESLKQDKGAEGIGSYFDALRNRYATTSQMLRAVNKDIDLLRQGYNVIGEESGKSFGVTEGSLRRIQAALQDIIKENKAGELNNIFSKKAKEEAASYNSQLKEAKARIKELKGIYKDSFKDSPKIDSGKFEQYRREFDQLRQFLKESGMERVAVNPFSKGYAQYSKDLNADYYKNLNAAQKDYDKTLASINAKREKGTVLSRQEWEASKKLIEEKTNALKQFNLTDVNLGKTPLPEKSWESYASNMRSVGEQRNRIEANIAASQAARIAKQNAEKANAQKLVQAEKTKEKAAQQYQAAIDKVNLAIAKGNQLQRYQYETLQRNVALAQEAARVAGARTTIENPLNDPRYSSLGNFNKTMAANNAMAWKNSGEVRTFSNEIGQLRQAHEALYRTYAADPSAKNLRSFMEVTAQLQKTTKEFDKFQRTVLKTGTVFDDFVIKAKSHMAWIASGFAIGAAFAVPSAAIDSMADIEKHMAGIKQVIPAIEGFEGFKSDDAGATAKNAEMLRAASKEMHDLIGISARFGESVEKTMEAARSIGRMYGRGENGVANTNIMTTQAAKMATADAFDMIDATKGLESAMAQWGLQTENSGELLANTSRILDVWTKTSHVSAASAQDLGQAIEVAGTAAAQAGVSFEFFNALVATGVRNTARSGNEIGTAVKSMMVSMQSDKSIKALEDFGIEVYRVSADGTRYMRSMQDIILETSLKLNTTTQNTDKLLMTLAGGKYQYSKVSAMLKDYKELLRVFDEASNSAGFTDQQVQIQMDTLVKQVGILKADLVDLATTSGEGGVLTLLKEMVKHLDRVVVGVNQWQQSWGSATNYVTGGIAALLVAFFGFKKVSTYLQVTAASMRLLRGETIAIRSAQEANIAIMAAERIARSGLITEAEREAMVKQINNAREAQETTYRNANIGAINRETAAVNANSMAKTANAGASAKSGAVSVASAGSGALATAMGSAGSSAVVAAGRVGLLRGALAALGGPVSAVVTVLTILVPLISYFADSAGAAKKATEELTNETNESVTKLQAQAEEAKRQAESAATLAEQYNKLSDAVKDESLSESERSKITEEMFAIDSHVSNMIHANSEQYMEDGKMKIESIRAYAKVNQEKAKEELQTIKAKLEADIAATNGQASAIQTRINNMYKEGVAVAGLEALYDSLYQQIADTAQAMGEYLNNISDDKHNAVGDWLIEQAQEMNQRNNNGLGAARTGKMEELQTEKANINASLGDLQKSLNLVDDVLYGIDHPNNPAEYKSVPEQDEEKKQKGSGSGSSRVEKPVFNYTSDETQATYNAANKYKSFGTAGMTKQRTLALAQLLSADESGNWTRQDIFRNGAENVWDSAFNFANQLNEKLAETGNDLKAALAALYPDISYEQLTNQANYLESLYDFGKESTLKFKDPTVASSGQLWSRLNAGMEQYAGLSYGTGANQVVCTTFTQAGLKAAGFDAELTDALTAWAPNWSTKAGAAFHPYGDGYVPKAGDIGLVNTSGGENGHAGHVIVIGADGGYWSASGSGRPSKYYDNNWENAYADLGIEGVIDTAAYFGMAGKLGNSLADRWTPEGTVGLPSFRRDYIGEQEKIFEDANKDYEAAKKGIERYIARFGEDFNSALMTMENETKKLKTAEMAESFWVKAQDSLGKSLKEYIDSHQGVKDVLNGADFAKLTNAEQSELAKATSDEAFEQLVQAWQTANDKVREVVEAAKDQRLLVDQLGGMMTPTEFEDRKLKDIENKYAAKEASGSVDSQVLAARRAEEERPILLERKQRLSQELAGAQQETQMMMSGKLAEIDAVKSELSSMYAELAAGGQVNNEQLAQQEQRLVSLQQQYNQLGIVGCQKEQEIRDALAQTDVALEKNRQSVEYVKYGFAQTLEDGIGTMFSNVLLEGQSFQEAWKNLWKQIASFALQQLMKIFIHKAIFSLLGLADGGSTGDSGGGLFGGLFAHGGRIPGYANGSYIQGAGTGTSDSILAYLANKDKFVYLSNGEYVMTAEATNRIGKDNLDAMNYNKYASGGSLTAPTPYIPSMSGSAVNRSMGALQTTYGSFSRLEQLTAEQTETLRGMTGEKSGDIVVLNTHASSDDVMKALHENPRAFQAMMGQRKNAGFR